MRPVRLFGIPVALHPLFVVLAIGLVVWQGWSGGLMAAAAAVGLGGALFGSVLLHELGHALAARRWFGVQTRSIVLHPLGGVAVLNSEPPTPQAELVVALAGPAVNLALAGIAGILWLAGAPFAGWFAAINLGMAVFNMIPAFPMDGGRVLRALWTQRMGRTEATRRTLRVARVFGWAFVGLGLVGPLNLSLIGVFVLFAVHSEQRRLSAFVAHPQPAPARLPVRRFRHPMS